MFIKELINRKISFATFNSISKTDERFITNIYVRLKVFGFILFMNTSLDKKVKSSGMEECVHTKRGLGDIWDFFY